jgi:hypothetical protein
MDDSDEKRSHTLYVEVNDELWGLLNDRIASEQKKNSNRRITRAEVVRDVLTKGLRR